MSVLIDSSIWIDYFRSGKLSKELDFFIDENQIVINKLILSELIPFLVIKKQTKLITLLYSVEIIPLNINWENIIELQIKCLRSGINKVGISDLIITQNAIQNNLKVYSLDKHFTLISQITNLNLI
ncbi:MAG: hypothetical protein ACD_79C01249G0002 [uncultured bacterium]|nr:MAG: hypothetical protein ACD_79C01249G0002 [uncultured bacterium]